MQKKFLIIPAFLILIFPSIVMAQGMMMGGTTEPDSDNHTAREEAEGKEVWVKFQAKELSCDNLTEDNFAVLGEYFMGQMMGSSHEAMNNMLVQKLGQEGEEQMHIILGKRLSGCDKQAVLSQENIGFMPMVEMMGNYHNFSSLNNQNNNSKCTTQPLTMMGGLWGGWGFGGGIMMILWWFLIIVGIVSLVKMFTGRSCCCKKDSEEKTKTDLKN